MFDLDQEILSWCQSVHKTGLNRQARIEELQDHLYCDVARLVEEGLSEEQAFSLAISRLGTTEALIAEHAKNRNLITVRYVQMHSYLANSLDNWRNTMDPKRASLLIIVVSLIFAAAMMLSSYLLRDTPYEQHAETVIYILIAIWFVPYTLFTVGAGGKNSIKSEYRWLKRKVTRLFGRG